MFAIKSTSRTFSVLFFAAILLALTFSALGIIPAHGAQLRNIFGSTVTPDHATYLPGISNVYSITVYNALNDDEWLDVITLTFPSGWTITALEGAMDDSCANPVSFTPGGIGTNTGTFTDSSAGYGEIQNDCSWNAVFTVDAPAGAAGDQTVNWALSGDEWGDIPHDIAGSFTLVADNTPTPTLTPTITATGPTPTITPTLTPTVSPTATITPTRTPNSSSFAFDDSGVSIEDLNDGSVAWGDYDRDGDLDFIANGCTYESIYWCSSGSTSFYKNNGNGTFTYIGSGPDLFYGFIALGDYDNDNDLDLLVSGSSFCSIWDCTSDTSIYRNDNGTFTQIYTLASTKYPAGAWVDYDNDGDLDVSAGIRIFINNAGAFSSTNAITLPLQNYLSVAWGDYDHDGDQDILVIGFPDSTLQWCARIYRNNGAGGFSALNTGLEAVKFYAAEGSASAAWGDYDNDGDLDLLLIGRYAADQSNLTKLYRNDGNVTFTEVNIGLAQVHHGSAAWGDYNNDGNSDILLSGMSTGPVSKIYRNNGNGTFTDINAELVAVDSGPHNAMAWGDYDNDSDLDVLLSGCLGSGCVSSGNRATKIYRNNTNNINAAPGAPQGLSASVNGQYVTLTWDDATDDHTSAAGLTYNIRVGTTPGGTDVVSPMSIANTGYRLAPQIGYAQGATYRFTLKPETTYYWSVQAIDSTFAGSRFATEATFTTGINPTPTPTPTKTPTKVPTIITFQSASAYDGWVLESSETGNKGGSMNSSAATFNLGDDAARKQYRGILSFSTGSLPDTAVITAVTLKIKKSAIVGGGNPVTTFQGFMVDIKNGFFGTAALQTADFQTTANQSYGPFSTALVGGWYSISLTAAKPFINKLATGSGLTQIRLRFKLDDNNNAVANYLSLYSGNAPAASRPQLVITYTMP